MPFLSPNQQRQSTEGSEANIISLTLSVLTNILPLESGLAGIRMSPFWILLELRMRGSVAKWLGCWTCNQQVVGSNPSLSAVEGNPGQVVNTCASVTKQYNLVPANRQ